MAHSPLYKRLTHELLRGDGVVGAVCAELQLRFGVRLAWHLSTAPWFVSLEPWGNFAGELQLCMQTFQVGMEEMHVVPNCGYTAEKGSARGTNL